MPIRLSDLAADRRDTTIQTALGPLAVTYRPNALTPADNARLTAAIGTRGFEVMLEQIEQLVVTWDLVGPVIDKDTGEAVVAADEVVPVKKEILQFCSSQLLGAIFQAILSDRDPKAKPSSETSGRLFQGSFS